MDATHLHPHTRAELRTWLTANAATAAYPVWVVIFKKDSGKQTVSYDDVLEEAICFGLIDTLTRTVDAAHYAICLRQRKPDSNWTNANKALAQKLQEAGKMTAAGLKAYQRADHS